MGKVKGRLVEHMKKYPELYNGHAYEDFWNEINKPTKRRSNVRKKRTKKS